MSSSARDHQVLLAHLKVAKAYAELSYAKRLKVGAVLVKDDRVISVGRNGTPSGRPNECETIDEVWKKYETENPDKYLSLMTSKPEVVHAEMNAIAFAAKSGVSTNQCIMVMTHSPCYDCSKLIVQSGIKKVYYETEYRITDGIKFLQECGVDVKRIYGSKEKIRKTTTP